MKSGEGGKHPMIKLIVGLLYPESDPGLKDWSRALLEEDFGEIERESPAFSFDFTDYYRAIAPKLLRRFFSFKALRIPDLIGWKRKALSMEAVSSKNRKSGRRVNVDPGYLDGARLVLASTKDNAHRIYLGEGIFAEVTLCRRKNAWVGFPYTFPDFRSGVYDAFLDDVRIDWLRDMRNAG